MAITAGLFTATCFANSAYANVVSTEECRAANLEAKGSCLSVSQWHQNGDDFGEKGVQGKNLPCWTIG